jgi:hypothetical protein
MSSKQQLFRWQTLLIALGMTAVYLWEYCYGCSVRLDGVMPLHDRLTAWFFFPHAMTAGQAFYWLPRGWSTTARLLPAAVPAFLPSLLYARCIVGLWSLIRTGRQRRVPIAAQ